MENSATEWNLNSLLWVNEKMLPGFGRLLESWLDVHRRYCAGASLDHPWAYDERPQIGLLSNAAVLIGGIALEEWGTEKIFDQDKKSYGRNDLWLRLRPSSKENDYSIESKYARIDLRNSINGIHEQVATTMDAAHGSAKALDPKYGKIIAISFFALRFEQENAEELDNKIRELLVSIQEQSRQKNNLDAIGAIWMGRENFEAIRKNRKIESEGWKSDEAGIILLASCKS